MKENEEHIIELLVRFYTDEVTAKEHEEVEAWLSLSAENQKLGKDIQTILEKASKNQTQFNYNTEQAWEKVKSKLEESKVIQMPARTSALQWSLRIAASILLLLSVIYITQQWTSPKLVELNLQSTNTTLQDRLPDGTQVFLNKNSKLDYVADKKAKEQRVKLTGEAYFSMSDNPSREFIIETLGVYVQDIGTKFNLRAYPKEEEIIVAVEEGEIRFYSDEDAGIQVLAGETGYYNKQEERFYKKELLDVNVLAYKTRVFVFNNTPLSIIVNALNQVYEQPIRLSGNIAACQITVSFKDETLASIAEILAETLGLSYHISGNEIILEGKSCGE